MIHTDTWYPAFKVVTIFYAPPGKQSSVSYGNGSTSGSSQLTSWGTQTGGNYGGTLSFLGGATADQACVFSTTTAHTERITKTESTTLGFNNGMGATDLPDHGYDVFYLWVNPKVKLTYSDSTITSTQWATSDGGPPVIIPLTARELLGKDSIPSYKLAMLDEPFTPEDVAAMLSVDPFYSGTVDSARMVKVKTQLIWGPDHAADPVPSFTGSWAFATGHDDTSGTSENERTQVTFSTGFDLFGLIKAQAHAGISFGTTFVQTQTASAGDTQSAGFVLRTNTVCYAQRVDIFFDRLLYTYAVVPTAEYNCSQAAKQSIGPSLKPGQARGSQLVTFKARDGAVVETYTDANGNYPVY